MAPANKTTKIIVNTKRKDSPKYFFMLPGMLKALLCTVFTNFFGLGHFTPTHATINIECILYLGVLIIIHGPVFYAKGYQNGVIFL